MIVYAVMNFTKLKLLNIVYTNNAINEGDTYKFK